MEREREREMKRGREGERRREREVRKESNAETSGGDTCKSSTPRIESVEFELHMIEQRMVGDTNDVSLHHTHTHVLVFCRNDCVVLYLYLFERWIKNGCSSFAFFYLDLILTGALCTLQTTSEYRTPKQSAPEGMPQRAWCAGYMCSLCLWGMCATYVSD